jgi:hypothetical protein
VGLPAYFQWYVTVLFDFVNEAGFTSYGILAEQLLDLVTRVPATRAPIAAAIPKLFAANRSYHDAIPFLVASAHIVSEYAENSLPVDTILQRLGDCKERVQQAFLTAAIKWVVQSGGAATTLVEKLQNFQRSQYLSVAGDAAIYCALAPVVSRPGVCAAITGWLERNQESDQDELVVPASLHTQIDLFREFGEPPVKVAVADVPEPKKPARRGLRRRQTFGERPEIRRVSGSPGVLAEEPIPDAIADVQLDPTPSESQVIGQNSILRVSLLSLKTEGTSIQANLMIANLSGSPISAIDVENGSLIATAIKPRGSIVYTLIIAVETPDADQVRTFVLTPRTAKPEPLEITIHQKASLFLQPIDPGEFDSGKCDAEGALTIRPNSTPQKCIRALSKSIGSKLVTTKATKTVELYSQTSYGAHVLISFRWEQGEALIGVRSSSAGLTAALVGEIEATLKTL